MIRNDLLLLVLASASSIYGFVSPDLLSTHQRSNVVRMFEKSTCNEDESSSSRRNFFGVTTGTMASIVLGGITSSVSSPPEAVNAIGPVKVDIVNPKIIGAVPCPPDKPIPGEKAMQGMRPMCVTVVGDYSEPVPKDLDKVGVYGFVTAEDGESVLANNPDGGTDAGQFTIIETVKKGETKCEFEFIAAVVAEKDLRQYENGIGPLQFSSLRLINFPGGQQYGAISPCEMNEFSDECEAWEEENGPYKRGDYMVKSNARTKGR